MIYSYLLVPKPSKTSSYVTSSTVSFYKSIYITTDEQMITMDASFEGSGATIASIIIPSNDVLTTISSNNFKSIVTTSTGNRPTISNFSSPSVITNTASLRPSVTVGHHPEDSTQLIIIFSAVSGAVFLMIVVVVVCLLICAWRYWRVQRQKKKLW